MKKTLITAILLSPFCLNAETVCTPDVHSDMVYFKHIEGKGYGYNEGYSTLGAFITPYSTFSQVLPFLDLRGHVFNRHWKFAANAGAGIKWLSDSPLVVGAAAYYDYRQTHKHHYNQVGLSLELLCHRWEFRANGYLPVGEKTHAKQLSETASYAFEKFSGHSLFYTTTYDIHRKVEFAMKGADAEFGFHLMNPSEDYTLYLGAGPYYFHSPEHIHRHAFGGLVRLQAHVTSYLTLQVSDSWDNLFHNKFQGEISVNIPFGGKVLKKNAAFNACCNEVLSMQARMVQPMHRNEIIVADKTKQHIVKTIDPIAQSIYGGPLNFIFANANAPSGGTGTFENPFNDLFAASIASSPNNVLYITGDFNLSEQVVIVQNQSVLGSGMAQSVPIQVTPTQITSIVIPQMSGSMPSLTQQTSNNTLYINGDNTVISGINFYLTQNNAGITNQKVDNSNFYPIQNITVTNNVMNTIGTVNPYGVYLTAFSGDILIKNNTINGNTTPGMLYGQNGIYLNEIGATGGAGSYVANVTISNNSLSSWNSQSGLNCPILIQTNLNTGQSTVAGASVLNVLIENNTVQDSAYSPAAGIWVFAGANSTINATILNNVSEANLYGMVFQAQDESTINITACDNSCLDNLNQGFYISVNDSATANLVLCDNTINGNQYTGIEVTPNFAWGTTTPQDGATVTALITGNVIRSNTDAGIYFDPQSGTVSSRLTFENNTLIDNGTSNGYSFYIANGVTSGSSSSTTTIFMDGNINNNFGYGLVNYNTSSLSFNIEEGGINEGVITLIESTSPQTGPYNFVERHTAAP